jgi:hypothetical protein
MIRYPATNRLIELVGFLLAGMIVCGATSLCGQDDSAEGGKPSNANEIKNRFSAMANRITIAPSGRPQDAFTFQSQPALSWSNPSRQTAAGAMFLWTESGRPQVALCLYPDGDQVIDLEFQSLSQNPLTADSDDQTLWAPSESGVRWEPIESSRPPGQTPAQRLRQMRVLAREFSARLVPPNKNPIELRLLETPVYRYELAEGIRKTGDELIDGSVFTFVQGTDPEVLLLLEAYEEAGQAKWRFALARMSMVPTQVSRDAAVIWETEWAIRRTYTPYFVYKSF